MVWICNFTKDIFGITNIFYLIQFLLGIDALTHIFEFISKRKTIFKKIFEVKI